MKKISYRGDKIALLKNDVEAWNWWRRENPLETIDLRKVDLSKQSLREIDLSNADLREADLTRADLNGADLTRADLGNVDFSKANLTLAFFKAAKLDGAKIIYAKLPGANFEKASLIEVDFSFSDINSCKFTGSLLKRTNFLGVKTLASFNVESIPGRSIKWQNAEFDGTIMDIYLYNSLPDITKEENKGKIVVLDYSIESNRVLISFEFPDHLKTVCEQYLLYFADFLNDQAKKLVSTELRHEGETTIFSVEPKDKDTALEQITNHLIYYLSLPIFREDEINVLQNENVDQAKALLKFQAEYYRLKERITFLNLEKQTFKTVAKSKINELKKDKRSLELKLDEKDRLIGAVLIESLRSAKANGKDVDINKTIDCLKLKIPMIGELQPIKTIEYAAKKLKQK